MAVFQRDGAIRPLPHTSPSGTPETQFSFEK
jgi:hypothetical protein